MEMELRQSGFQYQEGLAVELDTEEYDALVAAESIMMHSSP
jgi:hypothetical protein